MTTIQIIKYEVLNYYEYIYIFQIAADFQYKASVVGIIAYIYIYTHTHTHTPIASIF